MPPICRSSSQARHFPVAIMLSSLLLVPLGASLTLQSPILEERQSSALAITIPATAPSDASDAVPLDYPALAFSQHSFHQYAGNKSSPNVFSRNLVNSIATKLGTNVHVRVGGTSGDHATFVPSQTTALDKEASVGSIPFGMKIGPVWFEGFASWPGTKWTYMTHFANYGALDNSIAATKEYFKNVPSGDHEALEIGNEINKYPGVDRPSGWGVSTYISEWKNYSQAIRQQVSGAPNVFQAPVYIRNNCPWCIATTFSSGQGDDGNIRSAAVHHYMDSSANVDLQANYMNHSRIASQLDTLCKPPVAWLKKNRPNIPLHLAEDNSNIYSTNNYDKLGTFGNALWLVDYMLYAAFLNIKRMNVQQSTGFSYSSWRGITTDAGPAAVLPPYYAHPFVADVIGNGLSNLKLYNIPNTGDQFSAYGVYDSNGNPKRIVLINFQLYKSGSGTRPAKRVTLTVGSLTKSVKVEYLTAPAGDVQDASKISWKGQSWTYGSNGQPVNGQSTTINVPARNGKMTVTVRASEAVLLTL